MQGCNSSGIQPYHGQPCHPTLIALSQVGFFRVLRPRDFLRHRTTPTVSPDGRKKEDKGEKRIYEFILRVPTKLTFKHSWGGPMPEKNPGVWGETPITLKASQTPHNREKVQRLATDHSSQALYFRESCFITNLMLFDYFSSKIKMFK